MLASLLTAPIYGLIIINVHADEQLWKLAHFCYLKDFCNCFAIWREGYSLTHKSWAGLTLLYICKCYFHMNKRCRIKFISGRGKRAEITRNMIQIGNLHSWERFPGFIMFHDSLWWALFFSKQTNHPQNHWLFAHEWKWQGTGTRAKDCSPLGPEGISVLCPCLQVGIQAKEYPNLWRSSHQLPKRISHILCIYLE